MRAIAGQVATSPGSDIAIAEDPGAAIASVLPRSRRSSRDFQRALSRRLEGPTGGILRLLGGPTRRTPPAGELQVRGALPSTTDPGRGRPRRSDDVHCGLSGRPIRRRSCRGAAARRLRQEHRPARGARSGRTSLDSTDGRPCSPVARCQPPMRRKWHPCVSQCRPVGRRHARASCIQLSHGLPGSDLRLRADQEGLPKYVDTAYWLRDASVMAERRRVLERGVSSSRTSSLSRCSRTRPTSGSTTCSSTGLGSRGPMTSWATPCSASSQARASRIGHGAPGGGAA